MKEFTPIGLENDEFENRQIKFAGNFLKFRPSGFVFKVVSSRKH